jgi:hypothetical protein
MTWITVNAKKPGNDNGNGLGLGREGLDPSPDYSWGFVARVAKGGQMLSFSRIGRRRRSHTTLRRTIREKHDRWPPFAARSRYLVNSPG